ncbi:DUF4328 domain-containing protein [Intrasporangium flavum]|uniref:DUF4328 domain-containing protein n=1 Tax=Intrasporangium flavum TaxID=1428657 RepID=UPI00096D007C|nr:DUF4328 domain-containing protein [Intrasporangium flavum]
MDDDGRRSLGVSSVAGRPWHAETDRWGVVAAALLLLQVPLLVAQVVSAGSVLDAWRALDPVALEASSGRRLALAAVGFAALVGCAVVFFTWVRRIRTSERCEQVAVLGPRLAAWAWFIPVASVVLGPLALRDVCTGVAAARRRDRGLPAGRDGVMTVLLAVWAAALALVALIRRVGLAARR